MKIHPVEAEVLHPDIGTNGRTERHDEAYGRFSQICERAYKPIVDCGVRKSQCFFLRYIQNI